MTSEEAIKALKEHNARLEAFSELLAERMPKILEAIHETCERTAAKVFNEWTDKGEGNG